MTTAHRPTWKAAYGLSDSVGKGYVPTRSYSARDLPGYLKLKQRQWGQGSVDELKQKDFKSQLIKREAEAKRKKNGDIQIIEQVEPGKRQRIQQIDWISSVQPQKTKRILKPNQKEQVYRQQQQEEVNPFPEDEDSEQFIKQQAQQKKKKRIASDDDDDQDEDEDDNEELLREYEKIKEQRQRQEMHRREEKHRQSMANRQAELLKGNPLVDSSYSISKRWYEDTVFRNQAKKIEQKKTFINDYVRSDFHRKFMNRYVMR